MAAPANTVNDHSLDIIKLHLSNLSTAQLAEVIRHARWAHNLQSPLLHLPRELHNEIYNTVALFEWRDCVRSDADMPVQTGSQPFQIHSMRKFGQTCQQLRSESSDFLVRLEKLGMVEELFKVEEGQERWEMLDYKEISSLRSLQVWRQRFASAEDARRQVEFIEPQAEDHASDVNGII